MLRVRCVVSPENKKNIDTLLEKHGIIRDSGADIAIVEGGLEKPAAGVVIQFAADRIDLLEEAFAALRSAPEPAPPLLLGSRHNTWQSIPPNEVLFFRADGNYVYAATATAEYEVNQKLYELEDRFKGGNFIRTGKSYIVNILKVQEIIPWFGSRLLLRIAGSEQRIEVSRSYLKSFKAYLEM